MSDAWGFNAFGWRVMLKSPRWPVLFSERNGSIKVIPIARGWRITVRWIGDLT